jgi:hypothetical protein
MLPAERMIGRGRPRALLLLACLLAALAPPRAALAHGGQVWLDEDTGPFHVVVQTTPTDTERQVRFTVVVSQVDTADPVADATVRLSSALPGGRAAPDFVIPPEPGQPGFYDGSLTFPDYGQWQVTVSIARPGAQGSGQFTLPLQKVAGFDSPIWLIALLPVLVGAGIFFYFWRTGPKPSPEPEDDEDDAAGDPAPAENPSPAGRRDGPGA